MVGEQFLATGAKIYLISSDILQSNDAQVNHGLSVWTKKKEIKINILRPSPATIRIYFVLWTQVAPESIQGRIYKNGAAVGTTRSESAGSATAFTEDLSFAEGDLVQLYLYAPTDYSGSASNFRILGVRQVAEGELTFTNLL